MSAPIVPPSAPAFVAAVAAGLARRFDSLSADEQRRMPGGGTRDGYVAALLDEVLRGHCTEIAHMQPIGPAHRTLVAEVGTTPSGASVAVLREAYASGRVLWVVAVTSTNEPGGWRYLDGRSTRVSAVAAAEQEFAARVRRHRREGGA